MENPAAPDNLDPHGTGEQLLCNKCSADGATCDECSFFSGRTSAGGCATCQGKGPNGGWCARCNGDKPTVCLACGDWSNEALTREGHAIFSDEGMYATEDGRCEFCPITNWCGKRGAGDAASWAVCGCGARRQQGQPARRRQTPLQHPHPSQCGLQEPERRV